MEKGCISTRITKLEKKERERADGGSHSRASRVTNMFS
jgi:hypothetical protein